MNAESKKIRSQFTQLFNVDELASFVGTNAQTIQTITNKTTSYYKSFELKKRSGGSRTILAPKQQLLSIQKKIATTLEKIYPVSIYSHGFIYKKGIKTNAEEHLRSTELLNFDIDNFFDNIPEYRIFGIFRYYFNMNNYISGILKELTCVERHLPQGAPSSPILSNIICYKIDKDLGKLARRNHCKYTRYVDDITFSSKRKLPSSIYNRINKSCSNNIVKILSDSGFTINHRKTRLLTKSQRQEVTGITTNKQLNVSKTYIRSTRAMLYNFKNSKYQVANAKFKKYYKAKQNLNPNSEILPEEIIKGRISYIYQIRKSRKEQSLDNSVTHKLMQSFNMVYWPKGSKFDQKIANPEKFKLYNSIFEIEVKAKDEDLCEKDNIMTYTATAFLCEGKIYSCFHIFKKPKQIIEPKLKEYDCYTKKIRATYEIASIDFDQNFDVSIIHLNNTCKIKKSGFKSPKKDATENEQLILAGFPEFSHHQGNTLNLYKKNTQIEDIYKENITKLNKPPYSFSNKMKAEKNLLFFQYFSLFNKIIAVFV
ncbi:reverse transcriptase family protein [Oenococcus oeni]|uniref:reverse transcriptase family protein n=1 Tax=Oenococcus oeni TaxID=1247 RepID=UPI00050DB235|nr:reverse transcriptase family protein [Oenococcus oeni]KGI03970.1 hypothetical protein X298_01680 [Oenococcus oeni IOEB_L65_2]